jgi:signal peptidase I
LPEDGDTIREGNPLYDSYHLLHEHFEKDPQMVKRADGGYLLFTNNYFFMLGDNRNNSIDSRHFGPVRESHLVGRASNLLYSTDANARDFGGFFSRLLRAIP